MQYTAAVCLMLTTKEIYDCLTGNDDDDHVYEYTYLPLLKTSRRNRLPVDAASSLTHPGKIAFG